MNSVGLKWTGNLMQMVVDEKHVGYIATQHSGVIGQGLYTSKNFNDYGSVSGVWSCGNPTECSYCPSPYLGVLVTFASTVYVTQFYITETHIYCRIYINGWKLWVSVC